MGWCRYRNEFLDRLDMAERAAGGGACSSLEDDLEGEGPPSGSPVGTSSQSRRATLYKTAEEAMQGEISKVRNAQHTQDGPQLIRGRLNCRGPEGKSTWTPAASRTRWSRWLEASRGRVEKGR